ncbi:hypothetical protein [Pseudoxanthomonas beigongshangi]
MNAGNESISGYRRSLPERFSVVADGIVVNVDAELLFWEQEISTNGFPGLEHGFHQLRPTLKFSYDAYLAWRGQVLIELESVLKCSYDRQIDPRKRLDWFYAEQVVQVVWLRLGVAVAAWNPCK